ncbi:MAG TPA: hypothetical protein VE266_11880 [Steroidobacteraceae bacterium]|nr:hypothetical protein [Steroidobacteraceae bacterium]
MTWIFGRNLALSVAAAALLVGCGWGSSGDAAKSAAAKPVTAKAVTAADQLSRNMVSAVAASKPSTLPIQVKFELRDRPQVGQPVELDLAIVPMSASVDRVSGKVEGEEGLEVVEGAQIAPTDRPAEGTPIRQPVKVLPRQDGIFTVHVVVTIDAGGQTSSEAYAIPLIASSGTPDLPGKPAGPATAAAVAAAAPGRVGEPAHAGTPGTAAAQ